MNRPNFMEFDEKYFDLEVAEHLYLQELEKYCDELESTIDMLRTDDHFYQNKCIKLEKALDKACGMLDIVKYCSNKEPQRTKEEWKEWLLSEVSK